MHRVSRFSPEARILTTRVFQGDDLIGTERVEVSREAFVKPDPSGEGLLLVHNVNLDIFFVPLDQRYGFDEFVSHSYIQENNELFSVFYDGDSNLLRERTEKLKDPFAKAELLASGLKQLTFMQQQPNMQIRQVHLMLDCIERVGADRWVNDAA